MGLLSWFKTGTFTNVPRTFTPRASNTAPGPRQVNPGIGNYYEALRDSPDRSPIPSMALDFRAVVRSLNRDRLALLGRYLYDNYGPVSYAINTIANYAVPIIPQAASPNPAW